MPFFTKVFRSKDAATKKSSNPVSNGDAHSKPQWSDAWLRTRVDPEEVAELLHLCTAELKSRALDVPFLLLPFRPSSDPSAARTFVRNFFYPPQGRERLRGSALGAELRMTEVMVLISVMKWCWARLPGGVVTWETYEMFKVGEKDAGLARDAFTTFIPISVESNARVLIIQDFFDLLAAIAAHGKVNGLGGYKLSRYAGWWAFEHYDTGKGFDAGYKSWSNAADATSHLFFAYLRSLSPQPGKTSGILGLPRSLQHLLDATTYPPTHGLLSNHTTKVVMIVDVVSPTPYALLRRAKNFEYRDDDRDLQQFASYEDPVEALTDECRRVLRAISSTNQSNVSNAKTSTSLSDPSWSRFEDIGFGSSLDDVDEDDAVGRSGSLLVDGHKPISTHVATTASRTYTDLARPTTPSWADFLSTGFADEHGGKAPAPILLPPDKILPPINTTARGQSSQSHRRNFHPSPSLDPGELASISKVDVDDAFWWVWISSLAGEEPTSRKAAFGRCALIETVLPDGQWMVMEEQVKGAAPEPAAGAYIAEKKSFLGFTTKRGRLTRRRSGIKKSPLGPPLDSSSRAPLAPDQQAKIQQAAAELTKRKQAEERAATNGVRRGRADENLASSKTNSIFTLGPLIKDEASPALKWASQYDKKAIRAQYLSDKGAGRGSRELLTLPSNGLSINRSTSTLSVVSGNKDLPAPPKDPSRSPTPLDKTTPVHSLLATPSPAAPATTAAPPPPVVVELGPLPAAHSALGESRAVKVAAEVPPAAPTSDSVKTTASSKPQTGGPAKLRKSHDGTRTSPEQKKAKKTPSGPPPVQNKTGIRRLFGTKRSKSQEPSVQQPPDSPVDADPAIAAARRALEGKPALSLANPGSPPLSPGHFTRMATAKAPFAAVHTVMEQPAAAAAATTDLSTPAVNREPSLKLGPEPGPVEDSLPVPPQTRRDEEYDQLSRVDTDEREHAAREFSTFDQGPLLEQPAFAPADTPIRDEFFTSGPAPAATAAGVRPNHHQSIYTTVPVPTVDDDDHPERTSPVIPLDRWAQIRRNAAERAAQLPEDQISRSRTETRTDDGDTSGEETIESRVARIKARVAELTGNMDATRR